MFMTRKNLREICLTGEETLLEGLRAIDRGRIQMAVVEDHEGKLAGIVTDGDIRRGLLSGLPLDASLMNVLNTNFYSVSPDAQRADVLDTMLAREFDQVPVLDAAGRLHGVHLLTDFLSSKQRENLAVIMVGGKGTRLGELTRFLPKPMIKVAGRPILERIVHQLVGAGISRIYLAVNYLAGVIEEHFGDGQRFGCEILYLREEEPMGSGGALSLLPLDLTESILVMNGDLVSQFDIEAFFQTHESRGAAITVGVQDYKHKVPFGCVRIEDGCIRSLEEKPILARIINTGIYAITPEYVRQVPREFYPITRLLESALTAGDIVASHRVDEWVDVGQPDELARARGETE